MPRNLRNHAARFWNEQPDAIRDERWAWWLIGCSVVLIAAIGIFIA
jgi:hypothetical protein